MSTHRHKQNAPLAIKLAVLTLSTSRSLAEDQGGLWIKKQAAKEGHEVVFHDVRPDDRSAIQTAALEIIREHAPDALILTGGTGISPRDVTIEAIKPLFVKELVAFGVLFAQLSFEQIDSAAILSRATAGIVENTVIFSIPGSLKACKLACKELIFPELGHLVGHLREP